MKVSLDETLSYIIAVLHKMLCELEAKEGVVPDPDLEVRGQAGRWMGC